MVLISVCRLLQLLIVLSWKVEGQVRDTPILCYIDLCIHFSHKSSNTSFVVILGPSSDKRFGVANFPDACREKGLSVVVDEDILESNETSGKYEKETHQQLINSLELGGYNQRACTTGHDFTMFTINKPITAAA